MALFEFHIYDHTNNNLRVTALNPNPLDIELIYRVPSTKRAVASRVQRVIFDGKMKLMKSLYFA